MARKRSDQVGFGQMEQRFGGSGFSAQSRTSIEDLNRSSGLLLRARRSVKAVAVAGMRQTDRGQAPVTPILRDHKKRDQDGLRIIKHNAGEA